MKRPGLFGSAKSKCLCFALFAVALATGGCGGQSEEDLGLAETSVRTALDAWKDGQTAETLKSASSPVEFLDDDWQRGSRLVDYQLVKTYRETDGDPRCVVSLTLEHRGGKTETIEITYWVKTDPKVVITRDPYS